MSDFPLLLSLQIEIMLNEVRKGSFNKKLTARTKSPAEQNPVGPDHNVFYSVIFCVQSMFILLQSLRDTTFETIR